MAKNQILAKQTLNEDELDSVLGGVDVDERRKREIELGNFISKAYKQEQKNIDPNNVDLTILNELNQKIDIDNNYEPLEYNRNLPKIN